MHTSGGLLGAPAVSSISIDEHIVARFARRFLIPKGFHTIRNKKMRAEKLFVSFDTAARPLLNLLVTPAQGVSGPLERTA